MTEDNTKNDENGEAEDDAQTASNEASGLELDEIEELFNE